MPLELLTPLVPPVMTPKLVRLLIDPEFLIPNPDVPAEAPIEPLLDRLPIEPALRIPKAVIDAEALIEPLLVRLPIEPPRLFTMP